MPTNGKDTIYIDLDDEITTVIEKVRASNEKIVALVLPKRASVLQSIVNMKLLKRTADNAKKNVVLITAEAGLLPLAGAVGFHVAKNLQTKPEIPAVYGASDEDIIDDESMEGPEAVTAGVAGETEITARSAGSRPIGELAAASGAAAAANAADDVETVALDDDNGSASDDSAAASDDKPTKTPKKNKKLAVPNFNKFRLRLMLGAVVLVLLVVGLYFALAVLPKGSITLTTNTSDVNSSLTLSLDTGVKTLDQTTSTIPATYQKLDKSGSQQANATGKKNNGTPSTGSVSLTNCSVDGTERDIPAGTGVSASGQTFITQNTVKLVTSTFDSHGNCKSTSVNSTSVDVTAQNAGNITVASGTSMTVAGVSDIVSTAKGDITGGTDNIIQIVAQADIDSATAKLTAQNTTSIKSQLQTQLSQAGLFPILSTFAAGDPTTTASAKVGDQASSVTVTQTTTYSMFGVKQADLKTLVDNDVKKHIDTSKQTILSEGLSTATFHVNNATNTLAQVALTTSATAGPDLQADAIKTQVAGKKAGDIKSLLKNDPGVTDVQVKLSPFWVQKAPSKPAKLTVIFQKASS